MAVQLRTETIANLADLRDSVGVLSIYVDIDPRQQAVERPSWAIELENGLRIVRTKARAEWPREQWSRLFERLNELAPNLAALVDAGAPGRGRALFAAIGGDWLHEIALQVHLTNQVVLKGRPYLRPLLAAHDEGRPAGVVVCSKQRMRVLESNVGLIEEIAVIDLPGAEEDWREMKGPAAANPAMSQQTAPQRDRFSRRVRQRRSQALGGAGGDLRETIGDRGWDRLLLVGDPRLTTPLADGLGRFDGVLERMDQRLEGLSDEVVSEAVAPELERLNRQRELALARQLLGNAGARGLGVAGLSQTLAALEERRISHLLFDSAVDHQGLVTSEGRLLVENETSPGATADDLNVEPELVESMIAKALAIGAEVTPLDGPAAEVLAECDGIGALLRW